MEPVYSITLKQLLDYITEETVVLKVDTEGSECRVRFEKTIQLKHLLFSYKKEKNNYIFIDFNGLSLLGKKGNLFNFRYKFLNLILVPF